MLAPRGTAPSRGSYAFRLITCRSAFRRLDRHATLPTGLASCGAGDEPAARADRDGLADVCSTCRDGRPGVLATPIVRVIFQRAAFTRPIQQRRRYRPVLCLGCGYSIVRIARRSFLRSVKIERGDRRGTRSCDALLNVALVQLDCLSRPASAPRLRRCHATLLMVFSAGASTAAEGAGSPPRLSHPHRLGRDGRRAFGVSVRRRVDAGTGLLVHISDCPERLPQRQASSPRRYVGESGILEGFSRAPPFR